MKFKVEPPVKRACDYNVKVGDVFQSKGGCRTRIAMWVVVGITDHVQMIGLNPDGEVVSATSYAMHAMERRERIGFVPGLDELEFNVEPVA